MYKIVWDKILKSSPARQGVHGRGADALLWTNMKVFRTYLFVADVEKNVAPTSRLSRTQELLL